VPLVLAVALVAVPALALGLLDAGTWAVVAALTGLAWGAHAAPPAWRAPGRPGRVVALALALVAAAAALAGDATRRRDAGCARLVERGAAWVAALDADGAPPGALVSAVLARDGCRVRATVLVAHGEAPPGARVVLAGTAQPGDRALTVRDARVQAVLDVDPWVALRARTAAAIDSTFGDDAPMARALLVADMRGVDAGVRLRWADAGIVHMLSISGLHVAILGEAVTLLLGALGVGARGRVAGTALVLGAYVAMLGAPPPAVRSALMLAAGGVGRLLQRPTSPWAPLATGALVPLALDPRTVLDLGWQLSVGGMAALIASGALARRLLPPDWRGMRRALARELLTSVVATVVTAPLVCWQLGRLSLIAPLTNLVAAPLMGLAQPALFLALGSSAWPAAGRLFAAGAHPLLWGLDRVAAWGAAVPGGSVPVAPTLAVAVLAGVASVAFVVACVSRWPARPALVALLALVGCTWWPRAPGPATGAGLLELHVIDVGQGDALALRTPHGSWVVMDAGRDWPGGDAGARTVVPYLKRLGAERVRLFILSHAHADHVGGAAAVLMQLGADELWDGAWVGTTPGYRAMLAAARTRRTAWARVHPGLTRTVDGVEFTVLAPDSAWVARQEDANEASVVVRVRYGDVAFLLTGDAEGGEEAWLRAQGDSGLRADVLKVGHHGSRTSTTPALLEAVQPLLAVISVGRGNRYGHPNAGTLATLARAGTTVFRTDRGGTIVVRTDGHALEAEAGGERWREGARPE
jgi:competence protein ComEC